MAKQQTNGNPKRPVKDIRHRSIRAAIWRNETTNGPMYNVTLSRSWKDTEGAWHDTGSFAYDDLMNLAKVLFDAHSFISSIREREQPRLRPATRRSEPTTA